jgi:hypothetical protein
MICFPVEIVLQIWNIKGGQMKEKDFSKLYADWLTEDLVRASTVNREEYTAEAMSFIEAELKKRDVTIEQQQQIERKAAVEVHSAKKSLTGIRGWLLLFCIIVFLSSIVGIIKWSTVFEPILGIYGLVVFYLLTQLSKTFCQAFNRPLITML